MRGGAGRAGLTLLCSAANLARNPSSCSSTGASSSTSIRSSSSGTMGAVVVVCQKDRTSAVSPSFEVPHGGKGGA